MKQPSRFFSGYFSPVVLLSVFFSAAGCESPPIDPSSSADSLMVVVLSDLYLEEAGVQLATAALPDSVRTSPEAEALAHPERRDSVLDAHGLTEILFQKHMAPYLNDPDELQKLYDRVLDQLNLRRQTNQDP